MTVAQLIDQLKTMPQDVNVVYTGIDPDEFEIDHVKLYDSTANSWKQVELS